MKEIIEELKKQINTLKELNDDMNSASWPYEEGVIITGNQARKIVDKLSSFYPSDTEKRPVDSFESLAKYILKHKRASFLEKMDISVKDKESILRYFGYSASGLSR